MAKPQRKVPTISRAFLLLEASSFAGGGFPAYMNMIMADMEKAMVEAGFFGPYDWKFSGGDGVIVPVHLNCTEK